MGYARPGGEIFYLRPFRAKAEDRLPPRPPRPLSSGIASWREIIASSNFPQQNVRGNFAFRASEEHLPRDGLGEMLGDRADAAEAVAGDGSMSVVGAGSDGFGQRGVESRGEIWLKILTNQNSG